MTYARMMPNRTRAWGMRCAILGSIWSMLGLAIGCDGTPSCGREKLSPEWRDRGLEEEDNEVQICSSTPSDVRLMHRMPHSKWQEADQAESYYRWRLERGGFKDKPLESRPGTNFVRSRDGRTERVFLEVSRQNKFKRGDVILVTLHAQFD